MVFEARKQSMAWMETVYSTHTHFSMEDKMAARKNYRWEDAFKKNPLHFSKRVVDVPGPVTVVWPLHD